MGGSEGEGPELCRAYGQESGSMKARRFVFSSSLIFLHRIFFYRRREKQRNVEKRCVKIWDLANCNCIGTCRAHLPPGALFQDLAMSGDGEAMVQMAISENTVLSNRANRQSSQFAIRNLPTISKTQNGLALKLTCSIVVTFHRESAR